MGVFTKIGQLADRVFAKIAQMTKKLAQFIMQSIRQVAMIIGKFFTLLTQWLAKAMDYVAATFNVIIDGVQTFLKKVGDEYQEISYNYTQQQDGSYIKNTVVRQTFVSEDEIPADIKQLALQMEEGNMVDMSNATAAKQEYACEALKVA